MADLAEWTESTGQYTASATPAVMAGHGRLENSWRWSVRYHNPNYSEVTGGLVGPMSTEERARDLAIERARAALNRLTFP